MDACESGYDLIVSGYADVEPTLYSAAKMYPDQLFFNFDYSTHEDLDNVFAVTYSLSELGYLAGTLSSLVTTSGMEKANPEKPFNSRKKAVKEFNGVINYEKLRVAAGSLVIPEIRAEVDMENRRIFFTHEKEEIESVDCFLDDKSYAVLLCKTKYICRVEELGLRGETIEKSVNFSEKIAGEGLVIYVFAKNADGKDVSDSVCLWEAES